MAKNVGKFLLGTAVVGIAIAGGIAYLNKCKETDDTWDDDFEDFDDDFEEDLDDDDSNQTVTREYVTIPKEPKENSAADTQADDKNPNSPMEESEQNEADTPVEQDS